MIEAAQHPESAAVPAIQQLLVGRGTRHAVLTVNPTVQYRDTEPVVNEADWIFCDLERLITEGITDTQASVIRKTSQAFEMVLREATQVSVSPASKDRMQVAELLAAWA